ncbi:MAG: tRNA (adenosine(37)-N6)-threonylcarbamoyltransferase complex ATPase subunit type 1 TsaE [Rhodobacteraceae bacterium]|nr:tRNA (adenosine(37)-N6)-threonylcarbamoyltransferase complex ATPase subunit type 1 TsaE [Paracoccaceae bacterium]
MKHCFELNSLEDTKLLANVLAETLVAGDTVLLSGPVGAGKTELARMYIQTRLQETGAVEDVPSPTFTLVQVYELHDTEIWHADLYRLTAVDELYELGLDQAFEDSICLIEWPERLGSLRPESALSVTFDIIDDDIRRVSLEWTDSKWNTTVSLLSFMTKTQG